MLNKLVAADGVTLLTSSDFTWTNQGGASVTDQAPGIILLRAPGGTGENNRILTVASPSAPWTWIAALQIFAMVDDGASNPQLGLVLRESSTGKLITFGLNRQSSVAQRFAIDRWNSPTSPATTSWKNTNPICHAPVFWFKVEDNNTNLIYSLSDDGVNWIEVLSESRTAFLAGGPDEIGLTAENGGSAAAKDALIKLLHWHTE